MRNISVGELYNGKYPIICLNIVFQDARIVQAEVGNRLQDAWLVYREGNMGSDFIGDTWINWSHIPY